MALAMLLLFKMTWEGVRAKDTFSRYTTVSPS